MTTVTGALKSRALRADDDNVDSCASCGAALSAGAQWCGQCFAVPSPTVTSPVAAGRGLGVPVAPAAPLRRTEATRWGKTATTFGPLGRVMCTIGLVVPLVFFIIMTVVADPMTVVGVGIWGFVVMPWGLRDTWRAGRRVVP